MSTAGRERVEARFYKQLSGTAMPHERIKTMAVPDMEKQIFNITGYRFQEVLQSG